MKPNSLKMSIAVYLHKGFCKRPICQCHCEISGYHSNELQSVNTLHETVLYSKSRMRGQSFVSVYVRSVNSDNILMWKCEVYVCIKEMFYD
jgi:hypothetical protein